MTKGEIPYIALAAALYAVGKLATGFIPTPWGTGHLAIFIIIPVFFAFYLRPISIGVAAALGTFIASILLTPTGTTNPLLSLIAGVPSNFIGFCILGWWLRRFKSWNGFALGTFSSLFIGNFIAATNVVVFLSIFLPAWATLTFEAKLALILGFTIFWQTTMYPFVLLINPPLLKLLYPYTRLKGLEPPKWALAKPSFGLPLLAISVVFVTLFGLLHFTGFGEALALASPTKTRETISYLCLASSLVSFSTWILYSFIRR